MADVAQNERAGGAITDNPRPSHTHATNLAARLPNDSDAPFSAGRNYWSPPYRLSKYGITLSPICSTTRIAMRASMPGYQMRNMK